jgi:hypothetical protein
MLTENWVNCWNPEMGISSQASKEEGSETKFTENRHEQKFVRIKISKHTSAQHLTIKLKVMI